MYETKQKITITTILSVTRASEREREIEKRGLVGGNI